MNKKQIAAIKRLAAAIDACKKAGVNFANCNDSTLTPYSAKDYIVTYDESIHSEQGKVYLWDKEIPAADVLYLENHNSSTWEAHVERFQEHELLQIFISPTFLRTIADDGLVIVKNPNA